MAAASKHRSSIIQSAAKLFRKQGYSGTGLNDVLADSGAPKGSLYHYFPQGKEQLGEEALRFAGSAVVTTLQRIRQTHSNTADVLRAFASLLGKWMEASTFQDGCPMATTILETVPRLPGVTAAARDVFQLWQQEIQSMLIEDGLDPTASQRLASLSIAALEGSLIQARVHQSSTPISDSIEELARLIESRCA